MTDINALTRQPEEIDYSAPSQYRFSIIQLPKVQFFTTACNIPGVNMGDAIFPTPFKDIPVLPDKVTFENLEISFLQENVDQFPTSQSKINAPSDTPKPRTPDGAMYSDATLTILSNKNNPVLNVNFSNVYPVSLSALQYTNDQSDTQYMSATATFQYQLFKFESL